MKKFINGVQVEEFSTTTEPMLLEVFGNQGKIILIGVEENATHNTIMGKAFESIFNSNTFDAISLHLNTRFIGGNV